MDERQALFIANDVNSKSEGLAVDKFNRSSTDPSAPPFPREAIDQRSQTSQARVSQPDNFDDRSLANAPSTGRAAQNPGKNTGGLESLDAVMGEGQSSPFSKCISSAAEYDSEDGPNVLESNMGASAEAGSYAHENTVQPAFANLHHLAMEEGYNYSEFNPSIWPTLSTAVEYKMRTLIQEAVSVVMRDSREGTTLTLTKKSIEVAAQLLHWQIRTRTDVHTLASSSSIDQEILTDCPIDLETIEHEVSTPAPPLPTLTSEWQVINGKSLMDGKMVLAKAHTAAFTPGYRFVQSRDLADVRRPNRAVQLLFDRHTESSGLVALSGARLVGPANDAYLLIPPSVHLIDEESRYLQRMAQVVINAIEHTRDTSCSQATRAQDKIALSKIARSLSAGPCHPRLSALSLTLFCRMMTECVLQGPVDAVTIVLNLLDAFCGNIDRKLAPFEHQLLHAALLPLLTPAVGSGADQMSTCRATDTLPLRRHAARSVTNIVLGSLHTTGSRAAMEICLEIFEVAYLRESPALTTLIGAALGCLSLGVEAVKRCVRPVLPQIVTALRESMMTSEDHSSFPGPRPPHEAALAEREELRSVLLEILTECTQLLRKASLFRAVRPLAARSPPFAGDEPHSKAVTGALSGGEGSRSAAPT